MFVYRIILDFSLPIDTWDFRTASSLELVDAILIFRGFPFEEPEYLLVNPDEGPAPHMLFANLKRDIYLLISYEGRESFTLSVGEGRGKYAQFHNIAEKDVPMAISLLFKQPTLSYPNLLKSIQRLFEKRKAA